MLLLSCENCESFKRNLFITKPSVVAIHFSETPMGFIGDLLCFLIIFFSVLSASETF